MQGFLASALNPKALLFFFAHTQEQSADLELFLQQQISFRMGIEAKLAVVEGKSFSVYNCFQV